LEEDIAAAGAGQTPNLAVSVSCSFPEAEIFGVKLVNGKPTTAILDFTNNEAEPVTVGLIGGALSTNDALPAGSHPSAGVVRNLTFAKIDVEIPAGEKQSLTYKFTTELNPQDLRLNLVAAILKSGSVYQIQAYNETVSVVESAISIFDPQL